MGKSVVVLIYVTYFCCILQPVRTGTTYTSKACYGSGRLFCARHDLRCNPTQKIAIFDAYYTNNSDCALTGISNCETVNLANVTEHGYHRFSNNELLPLYSNCSRKTNCHYPAPRRSAALAFSVVKYRCIEGRITTESTNIRSPASTPSKTPRDITTWPNKDGLPISTSARFPPGVFMGGVAAGAVIVILVCLAVYVLVIRRRYDLTPKKQGDTPASVEHPTYSGLSARADVNSYTSIEQTSTSQEDTTHGSTVTPDYQNI